jgi:hypothetical protein
LGVTEADALKDEEEEDKADKKEAMFEKQNE